MNAANFRVNSNLAPCEGPRAIRVSLDFQMGGSEEIDFTPDIARGVISFVQSAYVDNLDGSDLTIETNMTRQRIKVPAGFQGYVSLLTGIDARVYVRMNMPGKAVIHFMNTPVIHSLVNASLIAVVPNSPDSPGQIGQTASDHDFFYWCYAPNSWARVARDQSWS